MELQAYSLQPKAFSLTKQAPSMAQIEESAKDFEAMFVSEMIKPMFEGLETDGMFGGGKGEEIFRGFMIEEYGKMIAATGQLGIADMVKQQMIEMQEKASGTKLAQEMHGENEGDAAAEDIGAL